MDNTHHTFTAPRNVGSTLRLPFYEWKAIEGGKQPYAIARQDGQPMAFAGLWEGFRWPDQRLLAASTS